MNRKQDKGYSGEPCCTPAPKAIDTLLHCIKSVGEAAIRLKEENDALRIDAERYRWIRNTQTFDLWGGTVLNEQLDAAIDAAMAGEE